MIRFQVAVLLSASFCAPWLQAQSSSTDGDPWPILQPADRTEPLPGTELLTREGDISRQLVEANDVFLDGRIAAAAEARAELWKSSGYDPAQRRAELAGMLGLDRDARDTETRFEHYSARKAGGTTADGISVSHVRWKALDGVDGVGLLLESEGKDRPILADVIAVPDAGQTPEDIAGMTDEATTSPYALLLAQAGCRVLVPTLVNREENEYRMTNREWLHRPAFELGRHLLGYELHQILAGVDALKNTTSKTRPLGALGWGEGGLLALYAAALELRIDAAAVSGYFGPREALWREPSEHNVFGLLETFGDAEVASLIAPRPLAIESGHHPDFVFRPDDTDGLEILDERPEKRGKPGRFPAASAEEVSAELSRLHAIAGLDWQAQSISAEKAVSAETLDAFAAALGLDSFDPSSPPARFENFAPAPEGSDPVAERHEKLATQIGRFNQRALIESGRERTEFFEKLDTESLETFEESIEFYREIFKNEVIGDFGLPLAEPNPRSRPYQEGPKTISYEVVLDVFDEVGREVFAYGILTLPKDLDPNSGEKRPVVVCQHGLEGTPQQTVGEDRYRSYKAFATRLAERGFVTFAPQNGYKYFDHFRMQQFKAQSIGKTLFSTIVPQHLQITEWLAEQPFVDPDKIAFYGLSYGGKSAMRIPPLVERYSLSICSADFNDWVWKNAATDPASLRYSYANKGEYEMYEWNLGGTFNYAEMAALICPRPFMVERGHFDGVAPDERVAHEFAKVRRLYQAKLGIEGRSEIEWFVGPHTINGEGAYQFLHKHLDWPQPE
ncbi:MAG: prolyl oligopeptidase family serine peptidase [Verrucomicrobiales bacterium]